MSKTKRLTFIFCIIAIAFCSIFFGLFSSIVTANAAGIDYTTKTFSSAPSSIGIEDEKYVYKISCFSPRGLVDDEDFEDYVTEVSFRASMGCQIYFVDGKACNSEDSSYGDYEWNKYANYYDILYYDATNKFVYIRFKNLAYLDDDENVSASLEDMCFLYDETMYNPAPQRIHYDIFAPTGNFYNTSGSKITSYYYKNAFYYKATDEGEGVSYTQYKKPGSTTWTTYTNGSTIAKTSTNGVYTFRAVDKQGNVSSESSIYLDSTVPTGKVYANSSVLASGGKTSATSLYYSATDTGGLSTCYVKKPGSSSYVQYSNGSSLTASGSYSFYCIDKAGNTSSTYTVLMDNDAPVINCDIAGFSETVNKAFTVSTSDALSSVTLYYRKPGQSTYTAHSETSMTIPVSSPDGRYYFYAKDALGNITDTVYIDLKVDVPVATIVKSNTDNRVYATWTDSNVTAILNGNSYTKGTWISAEGNYTLVIENSVTKRTNTYTFEISHFYKKGATVAPTCTAQGYTIYECISCNDYYYSDYVSANGHAYQTTVYPPSCTSQGYTVYVCKVCNYTYTGDYKQANGHTYDREIVEPTCTERGYTVSTCVDCGYNYISNYVSPLGHDYDPTSFGATCTEKGGTYYLCERCGDEYTTYTESELGHSYYAEQVDPTCEEDGYIRHICTRCGYDYETDFKSAFGHTYVTWVESSPDCYHDGSRIHQCQTCGSNYRKVIPCQGHQYEVTETETETGIKRTYTCKVCGDEYVEYLGDQYVEVSNFVDDLIEQYAPYMFMVFLATAGVWSAAMGIAIILAYKAEDKQKAKRMVKNYCIGLIVIFAILVACPYLVKGIAYLVAH